MTFFVSGLAAGSCFGGLLSSRRLTTFWFRKGDKFLIPTYRYYLGLGVFLLISLVLGYSISRTKGWILAPENNSILGQTVSALIVATAALIMFAVAQFIQSPDPVMLYLFAVLCFILLISAACWIFTSRLYLLGLGLNLLILPVAFGLLLLFARVFDISNDWADLVTYAVYDSLVAASCGFWIAKSNPSKSELLAN